jgi:hypothetical protein
VSVSDPRFEQFAEWMRRPSFGSRTKREVELKLFELLYRDRIAAGTVTTGDVAEELAVPRSRARGLLLETRTRLAAEPGAPSREQQLAAFVLQWPHRGSIERDGERLRVVVDDPFLRDLLQNFAYARGLAVDLSFSREIVSLTWPTYVALLRGLAGEKGVDEALETFAAEIRAGLREQRDLERAFRQVEQDAEKTKKTDRFVRYAKFAVQYALPVVEGVRGLTG